MTRYGRALWIDRFPRSRLPSYPRFRGQTETDVVIVGGGLTGCVTAYAFAAAGIRVMLIEADQIGRGASGSSTGWISDDPGLSFFEVEKQIGLKASRHAWQSWRRAALDFSALIRRLNLKCGFKFAGALHLAMTPEVAGRLLKEQKARRDAGLDAPAANTAAAVREVGIHASTALRLPEGGLIDPYRATLGLASAAASRGAQLFERSPAARISFTRKTVTVHANGGLIGARKVIVATGAPNQLSKALVRHFKYASAFVAVTDPLPAKVRHQLGRRETVVHDMVSPPHIIRWADDSLLVLGADSPQVAPRLRDQTIVQRTGQLMYELSTIYPDISGVPPAYGWESPYARTLLGLPCIGPHRNFPHHLFAFGDASHSVTSAYLASRILLRHYRDETEPADEAFRFRL